MSRSPKTPAPQSADDSSQLASTSTGRGSLLVIFLTVFVDLLGFGMVLPIVPLYAKSFSEKYALEAWQTGLLIGALMSSFSLMQFLLVPFWGRLSDHYGRRPIILIGLAGATFFYALFGVATAMQSLTLMFVARIGAGIAGATIATAQAYIADSTTTKNRNKGMALIGAAFALGFTLGPTLGGVAILAGGAIHLSPWPGYAAGLFSGVALLLAIFCLPESLRPGSEKAHSKLFDREALAAALRIPTIGTLLLTSFLAVFSFGNFESTLSLQIDTMVQKQTSPETTPAFLASLLRFANWLGHESPDNVKLIVVLAVFAYLGLVLTIVQGFVVRRLAGKVPETTMAIIGSVLATVGFLILGLAAMRADFHLLLIAMAVEVSGFALVNPSLQSLISRRSDPAVQGGILGLAQSTSSLARILGPVFGNYLFSRSVGAPFWAAAVLMVLAVVMMFFTIGAKQDFTPETKAV
ncbi:major facilitator superfamily MFS_1 [Pirellula staleyi DSM 6068]|uniref:Major facilitator superfamily MFS_1 n=1 Tax=Pirellula staleyi (strain ATCC 27377 / DSM 6068 / ICPB 4128) TaxID=530564 RepID=D2R1F2_PIRSD|nr:MFS transporter [Pirellula staleyi]ADB14937.1 major facilitator superfamily MFS_1 [Pirellula staleyi DSM 6068]